MRGEFTYPPEISLILALRSHAAQRSEAELPSEADLRALLDAMAAEREAHEAAEPADRSVEGVLLAANVGGTGGNADAPVPPTAGDRRIAADRGGDWPADEFQGHLDGSRYEHAVGMLDHAGSEAPATEAAAAIMACRARGLDEAADTLLRKVKARSAEEVLKVVGCLLGGGDEIDAYALAGAPA